jgi:hypothetical protein
MVVMAAVVVGKESEEIEEIGECNESEENRRDETISCMSSL